MTRRHVTLLTATLILLLAAALRIYHITQQSIWFDEAFAWNIVIQPDMYPRIAADTHPPLYYLLLRGWITLAGDSPLALRYLSALVSMGTVALVSQVARELVHGLRIRPDVRLWGPLAVMLVLALSDAEIFLAQETRNYSLYTFAACLSMWFYLRWLRRGARADAVGWVLGTAALIYTHYQGLFIPAVQGLHLVLFLRGRQRMMGVGLLGAIGVLFAPWFIGVTLPQAQRAIDNSLPYAIPTNWETFLALRDSYLGAQWALMAVLALVGLGVLARRPHPLTDDNIGLSPSPSNVEGSNRTSETGVRTRLSAFFLVALWFALPFAVLFFGNLYASLLTERKLLIVAPALALMIGLGLAAIPRGARGLLAAAILVYGVAAVDYYRVKEPWDEIAAQVVPYIEPSHLTMMEIGVGQYPVKYYWDDMLPESVRVATFPFLGDFTMGVTTDWFTYYEGALPQYLDVTKQESVGPVTTAWFLFWSQEMTNFARLDEAGYVRTATWTTEHLGNQIDLYRYDVLPQTPTATFENDMVLQAADLDAERLRVDLWWGASAPVEGDYTTSAVLLDANGTIAAQLDSPPPSPTSTWDADTTHYEAKFLQTGDDAPLPPGEYTVVVQVYRFVDGAIQQVMTADGEPNITLGTINR